MQQAVGEDVAALGVGAELDLVHRQELDLARQRHGLDGADEIVRPGRDDLLLAGDQGDGSHTAQLDDAVVDLTGQEPQRQADHARGVAQHPLDGQMRLAGVGGTQHRDQSRRGHACGAVAHALNLGCAGESGKRC